VLHEERTFGSAVGASYYEVCLMPTLSIRLSLVCVLSCWDRVGLSFPHPLGRSI